MTLFWHTGDPIEVETDDRGTPLRFRWRGEWHRVAEVQTHWRIDEHEVTTEAGLERVWRWYFQLVTEEVLLLTLYRDLVTGGWYITIIYD